MTNEIEVLRIILPESVMRGSPWVLSCCCLRLPSCSTLSAVWVVRTPCTWNEQGRNGFFGLDESELHTNDGNDMGVMIRSKDSTEYVDDNQALFSILFIDDEERQPLSVRTSSVRIN